ncbi:hypothetical protein J7M07_00355, partial [bacterium]|nr:hypothetical protein [bacterium]
MGDTECFYIYDIFENSEAEFVEKRDNIVRDMNHADANKMKQVIEIVKKADCLVAKRKSPSFVNIASNTRYQPVIVKSDSILDALTLLHKSFNEIQNYVTRRRNGECFNIIPVLQ